MVKPVTFDELDSFTKTDGAPWLSSRWRLLRLPTINGNSPSELMVEEMSLPMLGYEARTKHYGSNSMSFVGGVQIEGFNMSMIVDDAWRSVRYINDWFQTMQNPKTGGFYLPSRYMKTIRVAMFNTEGDQILTSKIDNCWPLSMGSPQLSASSDKTVISVEFKCFWQTLTWDK